MSLTMGYHYGPSADLLVLVCVRHEPPRPNSHPFEDYPLAGSAAILCTGGADVIRKEAWSFIRTSFGVRLCWELEEPEGSTEWAGRGGSLKSCRVGHERSTDVSTAINPTAAGALLHAFTRASAREETLHQGCVGSFLFNVGK